MEGRNTANGQNVIWFLQGTSLIPTGAVMTTQEVAEILRCSVATVDRYVHGHELEAVRIGRERRFRADDVLEFVARRPSTVHSTKARKRADRRLSGDRSHDRHR